MSESNVTPSGIITKLRKEIGGADPGTIYGDVLELCTAYEELAAAGKALTYLPIYNLPVEGDASLRTVAALKALLEERDRELIEKLKGDSDDPDEKENM